jgi:hypothetical protein
MKSILFITLLAGSFPFFTMTAVSDETTRGREAWQCTATDESGRRYTGSGPTQDQAIDIAMTSCRGHGDSDSCRIDDCQRLDR